VAIFQVATTGRASSSLPQSVRLLASCVELANVRHQIMKHYILLVLLSVGGVIFFSCYEATIDSSPEASQAAVMNTVRIISTLSWLGMYLSI
jgi:hypothetical protein